MKFINKYFVAGLLISFVLVSGITAIAVVVGGVTLTSSSQVIFDNTGVGLTATNAQKAVDELYTKINNKFAYSTADSYDGAAGTRVASRSKTLSVTKGVYLIIGRASFTSRSSDTKPSTFDEETSTPVLTNPVGTCELLNSRRYRPGATTKSAGSKYYSMISEHVRVWKCNIPSSTTLTLSTDYTGSLTAAATVTSDIAIDAVRIFTN